MEKNQARYFNNNNENNKISSYKLRGIKYIGYVIVSISYFGTVSEPY